jgi:hypothetical protein
VENGVYASQRPAQGLKIRHIPYSVLQTARVQPFEQRQRAGGEVEGAHLRATGHQLSADRSPDKAC